MTIFCYNVFLDGTIVPSEAKLLRCVYTDGDRILRVGNWSVTTGTWLRGFRDALNYHGIRHTVRVENICQSEFEKLYPDFVTEWL
jgi:hypothetical protein